ncbi:MAG: hypothetical protein IIA88_01865, partial [Bacteroidetes bacterium]|nr:hypothetical protein [Bacteroidota bacterium]
MLRRFSYKLAIILCYILTLKLSYTFAHLPAETILRNNTSHSGTSGQAGQCLLYEIPLLQKVQNSSFIIEGKVIDQHSVWNKDHTNIFTVHTIEIYKIFRKKALKPQIKGNYIKLITPGGIVGNEMVKVYPSVELEIGEYGIFFLNPQGFQNLAGLKDLLFEPFAGPQGFFHYNEYGSASTPFQFYGKVKDLYKAIQTITKKKYIQKQASPPFP